MQAQSASRLDDRAEFLSNHSLNKNLGEAQSPKAGDSAAPSHRCESLCKYSRMKITNQHPKKPVALKVLRELAVSLPAVSADILFQKLKDEGFTDDDATRLTGACIRTGAANGWIKKTNLCQNSKKNHSNLQKVWKSMVFDDRIDWRESLRYWAARGFVIPTAELSLWNQIQAQKLRDMQQTVSI